jgi:hypothetical protein
MVDPFDFNTVRSYQKQCEDEGAKERLVSEFLSARRARRRPIYALILERVGGWLILWGVRIHARFGEVKNSASMLGWLHHYVEDRLDYSRE